MDRLDRRIDDIWTQLRSFISVRVDFLTVLWGISHAINKLEALSAPSLQKFVRGWQFNTCNILYLSGARLRSSLASSESNLSRFASWKANCIPYSHLRPFRMQFRQLGLSSSPETISGHSDVQPARSLSTFSPPSLTRPTSLSGSHSWSVWLLLSSLDLHLAVVHSFIKWVKWNDKCIFCSSWYGVRYLWHGSWVIRVSKKICREDGDRCYGKISF
jgi:hypothetical protein